MLSLPTGRPRCAVLILSGSSGRIETDRVRLLAQHGAAALSLRWFGDVCGTNWSVLSAGLVLSVVPVIGVYVWMQRRFVAGMTLGAVTN